MFAYYIFIFLLGVLIEETLKKKNLLTVGIWPFLLHFGHIFRKIVMVADREINGP